MKRQLGVGASPQSFYVRPAPGWLDVAESELRHIIDTPMHRYKFTPIVTKLKSTLRVQRCDWRQGLEILLRLTTTHDVDWVLAETECGSWDRLHNILAQVAWREIIPQSGIAAHINARSTDGFTDSSSGLRDAVIRAAGLGGSDAAGPLRFKIDLRHQHLKLTLSLAGEPLYKRGYKATLSATAPLPEHLAAACARWTLGDVISQPESVDVVYIPFAGSGTLGFESICTLADIGPGAFLRRFACDELPCTPPATLDFIRRKLRQRFQEFNCPQINFVEINAAATDILTSNAEKFGHTKRITTTLADVFKQPTPSFDGNGKILVLLNPPYGQRLAKATDITVMYKQIGADMATLTTRHLTRVIGSCICPDENSWKALAKELRQFRLETRHFSHGGEDMRIVRWLA